MGVQAVGGVFANQERCGVCIPIDPLRVSAISEASQRSEDASKTAPPNSAGPRQGSQRFHFPGSAGTHKGCGPVATGFEASATPR